MSSKVKAQDEKRDKQWDRLDSIISRNFSASYMSNAKWVKLFKATCSLYPSVSEINYKLVHSGDVKSSIIEQYEEQIDEHWFIEPSIYKEIEWIEFPFDLNPKLIEFVKIIDQLGKYEIQHTTTGLRIMGYAKA
ncbi:MULTISPECIES: DUF6678 family protein [Shewanella]|uniref:Uncharacterized protein n=1 Tax=Shewanella carassii TaxID=1987584 RepID=A0ABQ1T3R3_9GAMM|nr:MULTISPECIES: DUF6678 family protein [Shewanella]MBO2587727.1 hypothetical protein [Shewanella algae]MBO2604571.1 hypothetical protein [Shewanella algae]QTE83391.1 hypothetical protein JKK46_05705 [Shewanella algae]GGE74322.1 hypothetical protein GCM10011520_13590 [Shewanella carassii]